jgi:glycosyltransferase involved in cell wall biosynthesis
MSNALLESQSWGIPAVVSAIPGNRAVVDDETNGLVVPVDDARALAAAIVRLLADPALRARLGGQARQRMIRDFSIASVAARIASLYREIAAAEKTRRGGSKKAAQLPD